MDKNESKNKWYFYVCCFFVYCVIGWIYEVIWEFKVGNGFVNKGFLHGCYLPVYGFGGIIILFSLKKLMNKKIEIKKINITPVIFFITILIIVSMIEYFTSVGMELIFHKRWWDYSYDILNLNGRISLRNSSLLAIGGMFYLYIVQPILNKLFSKVKDKNLKISAIVIILVMTIDFITVIF